MLGLCAGEAVETDDLDAYGRRSEDDRRASSSLPVLVPLAHGDRSAPSAGGRRGCSGPSGCSAAIALLASAVVLFAEVHRGGVVAVQLGSWPAPFGITLVADLFGGVDGAGDGGRRLRRIAVYATSDVDEAALEVGFFPFFHVLLMGVCGAFLTGDLFNLYVWFEVMLLASFVLLVSRRARSARPEAAGSSTSPSTSLASAFFLVGVGILYGKVGSLNLADLAIKLGGLGRDRSRPAPSPSCCSWPSASRPASSRSSSGSRPPTIRAGFAVSALFAGLLTKVGVYAILRVFTLAVPDRRVRRRRPAARDRRR